MNPYIKQLIETKGKLKNSTKEFAQILITELGGLSAVAKLLDMKVPSVIDWKKNGVPGGRIAYLQIIKPDLMCWKQLEEK